MSVDDSGNGVNSSSAMTDLSSTDTPRQTVEPLFFAAEAVIYVAMFLVGTVGNLLIVVFFLKSSSLRTTCNVFVVHLAVVDLVIIGLGVPLSLLLIVSSDIRRYDVACNVIGRIKTAGQTSSLCILLLIAVNRYTKICRRRYLYNRLFQTKSVALMVTAATLTGLAFACHRVGKIDAESRCCVLFVGGSGEYVGIILYVAIVAVMAVLYVHVFRTIRATRIRALQHRSPSPATNRSCRCVAASFVHVHRGGSGNDGSPGPAATATNTATAAAAAGSVHRQRRSHKNDAVPNSSDASTKAVGSDARNVTSVSMNVVSSSRQAMAVRGEVREVEVEGEEGKEAENSSTSQANVVTDSNSAKTKGARRLRGIMRKSVAAANPQDLSSSSSSGVEPDDRTRRPSSTERQRGVRFVSLSPLSETEADHAAVNDKSLDELGQEDCQDYQVSAWQTADSRSLVNPSSTDSVDQGIINPRLHSGDSAQSGAAASEGNDYYASPRHGTESTTAAWKTAASKSVSRSRINSRSSSSSSSSSNTNNSAAAQQASTVRNNATSANSNNPAVANVFVITNIGLRRADAENTAAVAASTRKKKRRKNTQGGSEDDNDDNDNDTTLNSVARGPSKRKDPRVAMSCARGRADCNRTATSAAREGAARSDHRTTAAHRTEAAESAGNSLSRTKIMLTVATMFVLLYAPIIAIRTYEVLSASTARDDIWLAYAVAVAQLLVTLNSCVNFVIYGVMNGAFRLVLKQSFLRCRH